MRSRRVTNQGFSIRDLLLHPAVWFLVASGTLVYLGIFAWSRHQSTLLNAEQYLIDREAIRVSEAPNWASSSLQECIDSFISVDRSLLDTDLLSEANDHLEKAPWIRSVERLEKSALGMQVHLRFREPIALLDPISAETKPRVKQQAVDGDGIVFDHALLEPVEYARLKSALILVNLPGLELSDTISWHRINDSRILPAAKLAEYLAADRQNLELFRIVSFQLEHRAAGNPQFELWTRNGTSIIWGSAPGMETANESTADRKLLAIREFVAEYGELQMFENRGTHAIDVTSGKPVVIKYGRVAQKSNWLETFK